MKKFFLSFFVILVFAIYAFYQRIGGKNEISVVGSKNIANAQATPPGAVLAISSTAGFKDGQYIGEVTDAYYGNIQVKVTIVNRRITDVQFLQYPNDRRTSIEINTQAMPYLKQEAIKSQDANVDIVSGATQTSEAFRQSLASALAKAK